MNVFEVLMMGARIYAIRVFDYLHIAVIYFFCTVCSIGIFTAFMLLNLIIAYLGGEGGNWIHQPAHLLAMGVSSLCALMCFAYLQFAAAGSHMHTCAQIGAGQKCPSIIGFVEYMQNNANAFFAIGILPAGISIVIMMVITTAEIFLFNISIASLIVLSAVCATVWFFVHSFFWFSYASRIVMKKNPIHAIRESFLIIAKKTLASIVLIAILHLLLVMPMITIFFYPIYFFVFFNPFCAIVTTAFYEKTVGLLK